jgi:membrane-associated phospholipid phosphatase
MRTMLGVILILILARPSVGFADVVTDWNQVLIEVIRNEPMGPTLATRAMAMAHVAMYDAVNSIDRTHEAYQPIINAPPNTSKEAAAATAAHDVLAHLFPSQQPSLDMALRGSLNKVAEGFNKSAGIALGQQSAAQIVSLRSHDNADLVVSYVPGSNPGDWAPTAPGFAPALTPGWGQVTPFAMQSGSQFLPPAPPPLTSPQYAAAFNEVKALGAVDSQIHTAEQAQIGIFWGYDRPGMGPPPILYNQIARTVATDLGNTLEANARLFALLNIALADAGVAAWDAKYTYNLWRPITAIREAARDNNPLTLPDMDWTPLGAPGGGVVPDFTPAFPAYISGHATFGAAAFGTLAHFYATDNVTFTIASDELPDILRTYNSFSAASEENADSRIYLGIHWRFDQTVGLITGNQIADFVFNTQLRPIPEPSTWLLLGSGLFGLVLWRRYVNI